MRSDDIRARFLDYFARHGHELRPSASLVPEDDPTLLFVNAGMVPFKRIFLGLENATHPRAASSQKCLRAGGKHNDLEQVGVTARHHTFFEMLGNFSFGDYFKRDAVAFAWELLVDEFGLQPERLWFTVHHSDKEAAQLWGEVAGVAEERVFRLGDEDNFWQMAETGPCGPCSEVHYDLRPDGEWGSPLEPEEFVGRAGRGEFLELWNLVFMQYDRDERGELNPLPAPSIDTGAGLERLAAVLQGVSSNYQTDLFGPLLERAAEVVGSPYQQGGETGVSYRVLADHARATAFLLADGVLPSNEGRGYVLRRILRRSVRHAWLLGRREPTVVEVVDAVVGGMKSSYPELHQRRDYLLRITRGEEERFLETIGAGMKRFDRIAPAGGSGRVSGEDAFRLYDTFGFPLDLTELMARERGRGVDTTGFERELERQRRRSRDDRAAAGPPLLEAHPAEGWEAVSGGEQEFVGYRTTEVDTDLLSFRRMEGGRVALQLRENPFYAESGGQVSDTGRVAGKGWEMSVSDVRLEGERVSVTGEPEGEFHPGRVRGSVAGQARRDTERNHTATHLLHAVLREALGEHVQQQGSLVAPDRLRFDFSHSGPLSSEELARVEEEVNRAVWDNAKVITRVMPYREALERGATALFSEKYGDTVRVVEVPGVSLELCGGTHVRYTGQIGLFRVTSESGVAAGVRRVEAVTGPAAYALTRERDERLERVAGLLRTTHENVAARVESLLHDRRRLERELERARSAGNSDRVGRLLAGAAEVAGARLVAGRVKTASAEEALALGDRLRERLGSGVAVLAVDTEGKVSLFCFVTDDLVARGVKADRLVREVAALTGGKGGGRAHLARAGVGDPAAVDEALEVAATALREQLAGAASG
ncbi:MAG: alanine--tRNA ligase [Longimicrobiaceae bacterium]